MIQDKAVILFKLETNYGIDAVPSAAVDAIITSVPKFVPIGEHRSRNIVRSSFGLPAGVNVGQGLQVEFSMELRGTTLGGDTPPEIFKILQASGMTQTIQSLNQVILKPNSDVDNKSATVIVNFDGIQHKILGMRGSGPTFNFNNNDIVTVDFSFQGIYAGDHASDQAFPEPTYNDEPDLIIFRGASLSLNSVTSLVFENIVFNVNNNLYRRPGSGSWSGTFSYSQVSRAPEAQTGA